MQRFERLILRLCGLRWLALCGVFFHVGPAFAAGGAGSAGFVPIVSGSATLVGARVLPLSLEHGQVVRVQVRLARALLLEKDERLSEAPQPLPRWQVSAHSTYLVDCDTAPPSATLERVDRQHQVESVTPAASWADESAVRAPPAEDAAAAFACLVVSGYTAQEAAEAVQQTAGLGKLERLSCDLVERASMRPMHLVVSVSDVPPAVRLGEKWLAAGTITPDYVAVADAGFDIRLRRSTGAVRVVLRSEMSNLASGKCVPLVSETLSRRNFPKKSNGW